MGCICPNKGQTIQLELDLELNIYILHRLSVSTDLRLTKIISSQNPKDISAKMLARKECVFFGCIKTILDNLIAKTRMICR